VKSPKFPLSLFPSAETLIVARESWVPDLFSAISSNPSFPPRLNTLAFLKCDLGEESMEELTRIAASRKDTASARLFRVVIVDSREKLPSDGSVEALEKYVSIVDVRMGKELPTDLA
jgi:hypothetical protein